MRIVCIAASFIPSKTANSIQVVKVAHALAASGHEVTLLVPGDKPAAWEAIRSHYGLTQQFEVRWLRENLTFRRYDYSFKAVREARKMQPDLVYTWVLQAAVLSLYKKTPHRSRNSRPGPGTAGTLAIPTILAFPDSASTADQYGCAAPGLDRGIWFDDRPR